MLPHVTSKLKTQLFLKFLLKISLEYFKTLFLVCKVFVPVQHELELCIRTIVDVLN